MPAVFVTLVPVVQVTGAGARKRTDSRSFASGSDSSDRRTAHRADPDPL